MFSTIRGIARAKPFILPKHFTSAAGKPTVSSSKPAPVATTTQLLNQHPATIVSTLPNGIRVATERIPGHLATVGVWIDAGSRYETPENNGVAHFVEHLLFKGTKRRSQLDIEVEVENLGASLNAYTSREQTVFYAKCLKKDVRQSLDLLGDILQNSNFAEDRINVEKQVILREMQEVDSQINEVVFDRLHETAFRGSPLARTILGPAENITNFTREDLLKYVKSHYVGPRMVIAGAGDIDHQEFVKYAADMFGGIPAESATPVHKAPANFVGSDIRCRYDDMGVAHVAYGFPTAGWADPDNTNLLVIQNLLGAWDNSNQNGVHSSSPLIAACASRDLCISISPFNTLYSDTGLFGLYAIAEPRALHELMHNVTNNITSLSYKIDEDRIREAKNQAAFGVLASLDGTNAVAEDIGRQLLTYGRRIHPTEALARLNEVTLESINATADRYFYDRCFALSAVGSVYELPDYNWLRGKTYWLRF